MEKQAVYIVDGTRTPFLKARTQPGPFTAADLAVQAGRSLLMRQSFSPQALDEVIIGCVAPSANETNIARIIALRLGCGSAMPAWTVQRNCASGMQAIDNAVTNIALGRSNLVLAGGTEAMSHAPLLFPQEMSTWLAQFSASKNILGKLQQFLKFRPHYLKPVVALLLGLTDPLEGLTMGQTAENLAYRFQISRAAMDTFAVQSHKQLANAEDQHFLTEKIPIIDANGQSYQIDDGIRPESSVEKLASLKPYFDKKFGLVTAANSAQITDGAAMLLLASAWAVKHYQLPVIAKITDSQWAGVEPSEMGIGPVHAVAPLLKRQQLALEDIDYWEINEAFAAQVLACVAAFADENYCRQHLHHDGALGKLDLSRLNIDGGAIALGHPVGASGARIVLHLAEILKRKQAKRGIASICIGGGQGGAMLIEQVTEVE